MDAATLLAAAGTFYMTHPMPETSTVQYQKVTDVGNTTGGLLGLLFCYLALQMAFLMAASATLENARQARDSKKVANDSVGMASSMLKSYKQAAQALSDRHQTLRSAPSKTEDKCQHYVLIMVTAPLFQQPISAASEQPTLLPLGCCQFIPSMHSHQHKSYGSVHIMQQLDWLSVRLHPAVLSCHGTVTAC